MGSSWGLTLALSSMCTTADNPSVAAGCVENERAEGRKGVSAWRSCASACTLGILGGFASTHPERCGNHVLLLGIGEVHRQVIVMPAAGRHKDCVDVSISLQQLTYCWDVTTVGDNLHNAHQVVLCGLVTLDFDSIYKEISAPLMPSLARLKGNCFHANMSFDKIKF